MSKFSTYRRKNQRKAHGHFYHNAEGQKQKAEAAASVEQFLAQRAAQINAWRADRGLPAIEDAAAAIQWERSVRLGGAA